MSFDDWMNISFGRESKGILKAGRYIFLRKDISEDFYFEAKKRILVKVSCVQEYDERNV